MKELGLTIVFWALAVTYAQADSYETYAFGNTEMEACEQVKSDLQDQAILQCRMNGGSLGQTEVGKCHVTQASSTRYKAFRSVEIFCKSD